MGRLAETGFYRNKSAQQCCTVIVAADLLIMKTPSFYPTVLSLLLFLLIIPTAYAQDEPILDALRDKLKTDAFNVGVLAQVGGTLQFDPENTTNGFDIRVARVSLRGNLDNGFNYFMQTEFVSSTTLLDARLGYQFNDRIGLHAGLFKAPFSGGFLISASGIDFVNRSLLTALVPRRQVGVTLHGTSGSGVLGYTIGMFNGNGRTLGGNDNNSMMFVGRVVLQPQVEGNLSIGANFSYSEDGTGAARTTWRRVGGDFRYVRNQLLFSGEAVYTDSDPEAAFTAGNNPFGYHVTLGYMIEQNVQQVLVRFEGFQLDLAGIDFQDQLVFGYNYWPTKAFLLQINYLLPINNADLQNNAIIAKLQVNI